MVLGLMKLASMVLVIALEKVQFRSLKVSVTTLLVLVKCDKPNGSLSYYKPKPNSPSMQHPGPIQFFQPTPFIINTRVKRGSNPPSLPKPPSPLLLHQYQNTIPGFTQLVHHLLPPITSTAQNHYPTLPYPKLQSQTPIAPYPFSRQIANRNMTHPLDDKSGGKSPSGTHKPFWDAIREEEAEERRQLE